MAFYIAVYGISYCVYIAVLSPVHCVPLFILLFILCHITLYHTLHLISYSIFILYSIFTLHCIINYIAVVYDISLFGPRGTVPRSRHCINGAPYLLSGRKPVRQSANLFFSTKTSFPIKRLRI